MDGEVEKSVILVTGMHRSGTSAVTRVLSLLGCALPRAVTESARDNEKGFWENPAIRDLNDRILVSAGSAWDDWEPFDSRWYASPIAGGFRDDARAILEDEFGDGRLFVVKDPRICRLLPFWTDAVRSFGAEPFIVSPVRNPLDVAASLEERDGIHPSIGLLMWLRHVLDTEAASRDLRRVYLRYEHLLFKTHAVVDRLGDALGGRVADAVNPHEHGDRGISVCPPCAIIKTTIPALSGIRDCPTGFGRASRFSIVGLAVPWCGRRIFPRSIESEPPLTTPRLPSAAPLQWG